MIKRKPTRKIKFQIIPLQIFFFIAAVLVTSTFYDSPTMADASTETNASGDVRGNGNKNMMIPDIKVINSGNAPSASEINITMPGYRIEPLFWNLTLPSSVAFDDTGNTMFIAESGFAYGGFKPTPRILKADVQTGNVSLLLDRMLNGPVTDIEYYKGKLYVSHRGLISTVDPNAGQIKDIIMDLPSTGDHHNNQIAFGPDGRLYFGQGTATNSGVVGLDNMDFGWLQVASKFHDTPGKNITLTGHNYETPNPITPNPNDNATTGAFVEFGNRTQEGQTILGKTKCNGCIISANPDGTDVKVVAWGLRNPYGVAFSPDNKTLLITMNGADVRGSRPIANDTDKIYTIDITNSSNIGQFYGWPDFYGNAEPVTEEKFQPAGANKSLQFLMENHPSVVKPLATVPIAAALTKADFLSSPNSQQQNGSNIIENGNFGFNKTVAFIAEFGPMVPATHPSLPPGLGFMPGHRVSVLDIETENITDFVVNPSHSFRPVGVEFNNDGNQSALYITSIGTMEVKIAMPNGAPLPGPTPWAYPYTGTIWRVTLEE